MNANNPGARLPPNIARRASLKAIAGALAGLVLPRQASAVSARPPFDQWIAAFRAQALAHGITDEIYARVISAVKPDTTGLEVSRSQPEFTIQLWQYLNRATSDWKIAAGREKAQQYAQLLTHIESDFGVEPSFMLGVWGIESAFGDPVVEKNHMRRSSRRWRRSPGPSRAAAGTGRASSSTR